MSADPWPRIGGSVPRPKSNPAKATKATEPARKQSAKRLVNPLAGKAPLGSLPAGKRHVGDAMGIKQKTVQEKIDQRYEARENRSQSVEPQRRGRPPSDADNPKVKIKPGTRREQMLGPNSTKSNKPR
jgi:hypothetical protein